MWVIKEAANANSCEPGIPILCGSIIRLEHSVTSKNLHSHLFRAPLSGNQEVSGFGDNGSGDTGDNWRVQCEGNEKYWQRGASIYFIHVDTAKILFSADNVKFNQQNCGGGCPIMNQNEVSASARKDVKNRWMTGQGLYIAPKAEDEYDREL
jgi:hypothetical protein